MALIDVISYSGDNNYLIYRAPQTEFSTLTQLIVHPGQEAIFVKDGVVLDILGQGRHTLHTANIPLLSKLINLPFGGESPFKCEVYFVNRTLSLNYKWGTSTPANVYDQVNQLYLTVAANGTLGLQLNDPHRLLTTVAGSEPLLTPQRCLDYFRENISMKVREFIAQVMTEPGMDFLALERNLSAFSQDIRARLAEEFLSVGVSLHSFVVAQFHVPEQQ